MSDKILLSIGNLSVAIDTEPDAGSVPKPPLTNTANVGGENEKIQWELQCRTAEYQRLNQMWTQYLHSQHIILNIVVVGTVTIAAAWLNWFGKNSTIHREASPAPDFLTPMAILIAIAYPVLAALWFSHGRMMRLIRQRMNEIGARVRKITGLPVFDWDDADSDWLNRLAFDIAVALVFLVPVSIALSYVVTDLIAMKPAPRYAVPSLVAIILGGGAIILGSVHYIRRYAVMVLESIGRRRGDSTNAG